MHTFASFTTSFQCLASQSYTRDSYLLYFVLSLTLQLHITSKIRLKPRVYPLKRMLFNNNHIRLSYATDDFAASRFEFNECVHSMQSRRRYCVKSKSHRKPTSLHQYIQPMLTHHRCAHIIFVCRAQQFWWYYKRYTPFFDIHHSV